MTHNGFLPVLLLFTAIWAAAMVPVLLEPLGGYPVVDAAWHHAWASEIAAGDVFVYAPYFRAPLYPMLLGLVYALTGPAPAAGAVLGFVLGSATLYAVYATVNRESGRKKAFWTAAVLSINAVFLFYSGLLLITPLFIMLLIISFSSFQARPGSCSGWLLLGLASVARPSAVAIVPLAFLLYPKARKRVWTFLLPVAAVWAINWSSGDPGTVISSQGGVNLFIGNGPNADGYTAFAPSVEGAGRPQDSLPYYDNVWTESLRPLPSGTPASQVSSYWFERSLFEFRSHPLTVLDLAFRKVLFMVSPVAIPSNYDLYYFTSMSPLFQVLAGSPRFPVAGLLLWLLVPGALSAGPLSGLERNALLWALVLTAAVLPFFVTARFMLPIMPFMVILLVPRFLKRPVRALILAPAGLAAGLVLAWHTSFTVATGGVNMAFHDGMAHYREGRLEESERLFLSSLETALARNDLDLNGTDALYNLGILALRRGDTDGAEVFWLRALERDPGYQPAAMALQGLTR